MPERVLVSILCTDINKDKDLTSLFANHIVCISLDMFYVDDLHRWPVKEYEREKKAMTFYPMAW